MNRLVVVENPKRWPLRLEGAEVVPARAYLVDEAYSTLRRAAVFNLCREYRYQSLGYYVSLLAAARGHRPLPSVSTLQDLGSGPAVRVLPQDLDTLVQRSLRHLVSSEFELSVYFGRNLASRYDRLCNALFNHFPAPFLRARFVRADRWRLVSLRPIAGEDVPESHRPFATEQTRRHFRRPRPSGRPSKRYRYDLAVLWRADDPEPPSNERAIGKFQRAARREGLDAVVVGPEDYGRVAEFDALFIRETTAVDHHTFRFARRAAAEGLVVIDDPDSIIRCTNKVFQAELMARSGISTPPTLVLHKGNIDRVEAEIGLPCVLKRPDSSFSLGVAKAETREGLRRQLEEAFRRSPLLIAQAWTPSDFDWRIGVLDRAPLFACRYYMVPGHWQIAQGPDGSRRRYGRVEAVAVAEVPREVVELGVRAASLMGDGLYGVDLKEVDGRAVVMEVNDNPNIDAGSEDAVLGDSLYREVMRHFRRRLDARGGEGEAP